MKAIAVVGGQYGDEGKGKFVHYLVHAEKIRIVGRGNGGCNAGHNVYDPERGISLALHLMPSGIFGTDVVNIVGDGTVINPYNFIEEMDTVEQAGVVLTPESLKLSTRAHITFQTQRYLDSVTDKVGSTGQGIGPTYREKIVRTGLRLEIFLRDTWQQDVTSLLEQHNQELAYLGRVDLQVDIAQELIKLEKAADRLKPYIVDTVAFLHGQSNSEQILLEGAQATMLDINHGTYPFVTASSTTAGGLANGLGLPPSSIKRVVGVFKLPMTRVGKGPFTTRLTEDENDIYEKLAGIKGEKGAEFGATTGRARDIGWMDLLVARYAHAINDFTDIGLTKLDMLSGIKELKLATAYNLDGREITNIPADTADIERCEPVYTILPGWEDDISGVTDFSKLPVNAQKYIEFIEQFIDSPVTMIGTGPDNNDMILRTKG